MHRSFSEPSARNHVFRRIFKVHLCIFNRSGIERFISHFSFISHVKLICNDDADDGDKYGQCDMLDWTVKFMNKILFLFYAHIIHRCIYCVYVCGVTVHFVTVIFFNTHIYIVIFDIISYFYHPIYVHIEYFKQSISNRACFLTQYAHIHSFLFYDSIFSSSSIERCPIHFQIPKARKL